MSTHSLRRLSFALIGAFLVSTSSLAAQSRPLRDGFFIGFGFGGAGGEVTGNANANGGAGWLTLGGTVNQKVRLAADFNGFSPEKNDQANYATSTFSVLYYPSESGNFFLKAGVGAAEASFSNPDGRGVGFGTAWGVGYDFRVGRNVSITPQLSAFGGRTGDIEDSGGNPVANDVKFGLVAFTVGVVFH